MNLKSGWYVALLGATVAALLASVVGLIPKVAAAPSAPEAAGQDARLVAFLQKRFRMSSIKLGPATPAPVAGLVSRVMTVTNEQGMSANVTLFTDASGKDVILGQLLDASKDPWGRIDMKDVHLDDRPAAGPADAPVTVVEFGDFECPFCARALNIVETMVNTTYKGRVRLVFKNFPLAGHLWAMEAATAAECARLQSPDAFWGFARDLYRDQAAINPKNVREHIDQYASGLQLDTKALSACMIGRPAAERIQEDVKDATALDVKSTPTFYVNGIPVVGFPDPKSLSFVIDSELRNRQTAASKP